MNNLDRPTAEMINRFSGIDQTLQPPNPRFLCRAYNSANPSIATGGLPKLLTFNSERYDFGNLHSTVTNTGRLTMPVAGFYHVGFSGEFAANGTGIRAASIRINGGTVIASTFANNLTASFVVILNLSTDYYFAAGDYVDVVVFQNSGGALDMQASGNYSPEFWAHFLSV